jgi:hypothetical protein
MTNRERTPMLSLSRTSFCLLALCNLSQCHTGEDQELGNKDLAFFPLSPHTAFFLGARYPFRLDTCHFTNSLLETWTHFNHLRKVSPLIQGMELFTAHKQEYHRNITA